MAAVGSAVGLGNFWRFPYEAGTNGGGAFVIVYLLCVLLLAIPLVICEFSIGRRAGLSAVGSTRKVARDEGRSGGWSIVGWLGMTTSLLILSFYSVIAGWVLAYIPITASGAFAGGDAAETAQTFEGLLANPPVMILSHTVFMLITGFVIWRGLHKGIEAVVNVLMPLFFVMLIGMAAFALVIGDAGQAIAFLFKPDFSKITPEVVISAVGQAFFSVGVGVAIMLTYGAYLDKTVNIPRSAAIIAFADSLVAMCAGLLIFPIVFGFGLDPGAGPGLIFVTLPVAFGQMPFGALVGTAFFVLALVAAITSSISILEIFVSWAEEHRGLERRKGTLIGGAAVWLVGIGSVLSFNHWQGFHPLDFIPFFEGKNFFDVLDTLTDSVMLPVGGLLVAVFSGWVLSERLFREETGLTGKNFATWRFLVRYVAPVFLLVVLLARMRVLDL